MIEPRTPVKGVVEIVWNSGFVDFCLHTLNLVPFAKTSLIKDEDSWV